MKVGKSKAIVFFLVFALLVTTVVVTSVANAKTTDIQITADKTVLKAGESATVSVKVTTNYPVATMSIPVFYDKTLVAVSDAMAVLTGYSVTETTTDSQSVDAAKVYENTNISSNKFGFVLATYIAAANADIAETVDSVVLTFKITAKADVSGNAVIKVVNNSAKTSTNTEGMLYFGASTSDTKITEVPENVENIDLTEAIENIVISKETKSNTLKLNENAPFEAIIDTVNCGDYTGAIYGFDTLGWNDDFAVDGAIADFVTTAYGDEYLEVVVGDAGVETTGTLINVLDEEGNAVETYVFIYFGDIDMDGTITSTDGSICEFYEMNYTGLETLYQFMSADLDSDAVPTSTDGSVCEFFEMNYFGMPLQTDVGAVASSNAYEIY